MGTLLEMTRERYTFAKPHLVAGVSRRNSKCRRDTRNWITAITNAESVKRNGAVSRSFFGHNSLRFLSLRSQESLAWLLATMRIYSAGALYLRLPPRSSELARPTLILTRQNRAGFRAYDNAVLRSRVAVLRQDERVSSSFHTPMTLEVSR